MKQKKTRLNTIIQEVKGHGRKYSFRVTIYDSSQKIHFSSHADSFEQAKALAQNYLNLFYNPKPKTIS